MKKLFLFALLLLTWSAELLAQTTTVTGRVTDGATGAGLIGVNVVVKGTTIGTATDRDGNFTIGVKPEATRLVFSLVGFKTVEQDASTAGPLAVALVEGGVLTDEVVVSASRVPESILKSPVTVEKLDARTIRETGAANFWDALNNVKGVDLGTQSINFKSVNLRGFGANNNTRVVQWFDGMDSRSPGLGFGFGNVAGVSELDVDNVEIVPGAASALYGPDALNGIVLTTSKDPFEYQGLSLQIKNGLNNVNSPATKNATLLTDYAIRYAKSFNNRFAFKLNAAYFRATDWIARDAQDRRDRTRPAGFEPGTRDTNPLYDGLNVYGDEFGNAITIDSTISKTSALRGTRLTRTGYPEQDLLDTDVHSLRLGGALHYRLTDKLEAIALVNYGDGNLVQTAGQRVYYPDYKRTQAKLELRADNFYLRAYTTQQTAEGYGTGTVAQAINRTYSTNPVWAKDYVSAYDGLVPGVAAASAATARAYADRNRFQPGTPAFDAAKAASANRLTTEGGARQLENSDLWHGEGMYNFKNQFQFVDLIVGGHFREYRLNSARTLFPLASDGKEYTVQEYGGYAQLAHTFALADELSVRPTFAARYDKNEYLKGGFTPRGSAVLTWKTHNLRGSYQTAFRNPSPGNLFAFNIVPNNLSELGGTELIANRANLFNNPAYTEASVLAYRTSKDPGVLVQYTPQIIKTEKIATWEVGYKSVIAQSLFIDAFYFHSRYSDFIANQNFVQPTNSNVTDLLEPGTSTRYQINLNKVDQILVNGVGLGLDYALPGSFRLSTNYTYQEGKDKTTGKKLSDPVVTAKGRNFFNSPENRTNVSFSNAKLTQHVGFNLTWRWQDRTWWEQGFAGDTWIPAFHTFDAQVSYRLPALYSTVKVGGSNLFNRYYSQGYGLPQVGGVYYVSIVLEDLLK
ncbi:TonB-dependent receptor [Hymenobacter terrenus]|uniref:TonB-dependent receptor n=1 Tax=Hymenobacter terrenus TaxID=1629124 RepID=UPI0006199452|nr:TonB-dependent receptor [Hymenobacter terrenus]